MDHYLQNYMLIFMQCFNAVWWLEFFLYLLIIVCVIKKFTFFIHYGQKEVMFITDSLHITM